MKDIKNKTTNWKIITAVSVVLFFILAIVAFKVVSNFLDADIPYISNTTEEKPVCEDCVRRYIDGVYVKSGQENLYPIAVVIDNHTEARPPRGISKANLVYEAEAEGRITRYLAIFANDEDIEAIGPVRSARPYFIDWLSEFNALFIHCGGSPEALARVIKEEVLDLNEFYNGAYYWREEARPSSHDLFTSSENLKAYLDKKDLTEGKYFSWLYKEDQPTEDTSSSSTISFSYKEPYYVGEWKYDEENNDYVRYVAGEKHTEEDGSEIRAKNVIIQYGDTEVIDDVLRLNITTIGENKAMICLDGECREGKWSKKSKTARTRYYYDSGEEVNFNAGTTWIQVMRSTEISL